MTHRRQLAVLAIVAALFLSLGAIQSATITYDAPPPDYIVDKFNSKGKGPKCTREVFCVPARCEQAVCSGNSCNCVCEPIPGCVPTE